MEQPARWLLPASEPVEAERLAASLGLSLPAARVLVRRGYRDPASAQRFLYPSLDDLHDPHLMRGMDQALDRLRRAIAGSEKILLYGDYDVDGTTSVAILKKAIELAGGCASFLIPNRVKDGYGMRPEAVAYAAARGVTLIVSVDTGIRANEAVRHARQAGIDVIVTDHHLPDAEIPPALAVLNPQQSSCAYPDKNLCGAGVAFKLVEALLATLDWPPEKLRRMMESFLKVVAIATVANVVPLTGENRVFVKLGLEGLRSVRNAGLRALLDVAGFSEGEALSAAQVAFRIAPRLNAAGRMADANTIVDLLLTEDAARARELAGNLHALNRERQQTETDIVRAILDECLAAPVTDQQAALVFAGKDWHRGVVGIVASRLVERFHRPVVVLGDDPGQKVAQGSGRSIPAFHLLEALEAMPDLFIRFGGHRQAAGITIASERIDEFRERLNAYAARRLTPDHFTAEVEVDAALDFQEINERSAAGVLSLAPFGFGNPTPVFAALGVEVAAAPTVWKEKHVRVNLHQSGRTIAFKAWNFAGRIPELQPGIPIDVAFSLESDEYSAARGYPGWYASLRDIRRAR